MRTFIRYMNLHLKSGQGFGSRTGYFQFERLLIRDLGSPIQVHTRCLSMDMIKHNSTPPCKDPGKKADDDAKSHGTESCKSSKINLSKNHQQKIEEELMIMNSAVKQHYQHANYTEALRVSHDVLEKSVAIFGSNHPAVASAHNNIGLMHKMMGEFEMARTNYHYALNIYQDIVGKDHASYAAALSNLGNLDRAQSMTDENLSHFERLQMNESAIEYFEESWNIRKVELGLQHPHTVITQSNLGGAIAAQVLQGELFRRKLLKEQNGNSEGNFGEDHNRATSKITREKWDLAEEHLRLALQTAINNPNGKQIQITLDEKDKLPPRRNSTLKSKKEKRDASKLRKKLEKQISQDEGAIELSLETNTSIRTLTAAAAAQNLAVFLKSRADIVSKYTDDISSLGQSLSSGEMYAEARSLYSGALKVRTQLRGEHHPDTIASKFSLAELIDAIGDEAGANKIRQELLDSYQVEEHDGNPTAYDKT